VKNKQENKEKPLQNNKRRLRRQFFREMSTVNQGVAVWQLYISVSWCNGPYFVLGAIPFNVHTPPMNEVNKI
jgi:hypothetical protein